MDYLISDMWDYLMSTVSGTLEYKALVVMGMLLALLVLVVPGRKLGDRIAFAALAAYLTLVFASTVLLRSTAHSTGLSLVPFSTYAVAFGEGNRTILFEILENIVLFIPAGLALGYLSRESGFWASLLAIAGTAMFSLGIECLQYIYEVGICEFDDFFNNTLGIVIGFVVARLICAPFTHGKKSPVAQTPQTPQVPHAQHSEPQSADEFSPGQTTVVNRQPGARGTEWRDNVGRNANGSSRGFDDNPWRGNTKRWQR